MGDWVCDVCNDSVSDENDLALFDCVVTDWGLYCERCALKYRSKKGTKISGYPAIKTFKKGERITLPEPRIEFW